MPMTLDEAFEELRRPAFRLLGMGDIDGALNLLESYGEECGKDVMDKVGVTVVEKDKVLSGTIVHTGAEKVEKANKMWRGMRDDADTEA